MQQIYKLERSLSHPIHAGDRPIEDFVIHTKM